MTSLRCVLYNFGEALYSFYLLVGENIIVNSILYTFGLSGIFVLPNLQEHMFGLGRCPYNFGEALSPFYLLAWRKYNSFFDVLLNTKVSFGNDV